MSEHEQPERDDQILDANLERLLSHAQQRPEVPSEARARMLGRLREAVKPEPAKPAPAANEQPAANQPSTRRRLGALTIVVALAAAVILAWVLGLGQRLLGDDDQGATEIAEYVHEELGAKAITLADGSRAILRTGTTLQELAPRHLRLLGGEVLLDVGEAVEPFIIDTPEGRALVLGTRVLLRSDGAETLAAVFHGSARVESSATEVLLHAGEQALLRSAAAPERIAGRRLSFEIDWARELLAPSQTPEPIRRGNLLARVPRWTGQIAQGPEWPLPIRELTVDVHVEGGHVRTTIDQTFFNHLDRDLEGVYQFPLPPKAAISRLAMYVDGERMEAGVVGRDRGRDIYEQIVHRRRDPALLEWMQGNLFQVRIFPLPARTEKRILLSYTAALDELYGAGELRVPIPEIDLPVAKITYRIRVVGAAGREFAPRSHAFEVREDGGDLIAEYSAANQTIGADIVASLAVGAKGAPPPSVEHHRFVDDQGRRHHGLRLRPDLRAELDALGPAETSAAARDWIVLFDSSASRGAAELGAQRQFVAEFVAQLDGGDRLALAAFDSRVRWFDEGLTTIARLDRAALERFVERESRVGLGLTDLGAGIDAALERLAAAPAPSDDARERIPTLLYLGDGLGQDLVDASADPGSYVESLARRFAGRASFVGVSFGQAYDEPALTRLAAAGEGLHVHVAEGDAVAWRALELLTTLATPRVLDLDASLLDADGQVIAGDQTHASARSLADGETLEVLARLPEGAPEPVAVELRGRASFGADQAKRGWTKRIELPSPADGARWLPRAWARDHVAALTEAGVEQNAAAITELGLAHFLVTPTTSLLVLENEAMYRDFDVHRPPADAWARYPAPDRIEVIRERARVEADHGQYVVRTPVEMLRVYSSHWNVQTRSRGPISTTGIGGLGLVGTGRGGGGFGFGVGEGMIGLGNTGIVGKGSGSGYGRGSGAGFGGRGLRVRDRADDAKSVKRKRSEFGGFVSRNSLAQSWSSSSATPIAPPAGAAADFDARFAATVVGASLHAEVLDTLAPGVMPWPQALHYSRDWRLGDLGELVPALFEDAFDLEREQLLITGLDGTAGSISEPAAELIAAARRAQANVRFALPEGGTLDIDDAGRFALIHERWGFLAERVVYDGDRLHADYPQLGLSVVRAVGPTSPALLGAWVPWMVPEAEDLARFYDVTRIGPRTLKLSAIVNPEATATAAEQRPWLEVELDEADRVIALRVHLGEQIVSTTEFRWTAEGVELDGGRTLTRVGPASAIAGQPQATVVNLPLPSPVDLEAALVERSPGSPEWIAIQQQRLAGAAALGQTGELQTILVELAEHGGRVVPGELVLGGAGLSFAPAAVRKQVLAAASEGPIRAYVEAAALAYDGRIVATRKLAADEELVGTPVGFLASYRALLHEAERRPGEPAVRRLEKFLATYDHPNFAFVAVSQLSNGWWSSYERRARAWLALAEQDGPWTYLALHQAGISTYYRGRYEDAAAIFERAFADAAADETMPVVDWTVRAALVHTIGEVGFELAWTRMRERVAKSRDPRLALRFLLTAEQLGRADEAQRVLDDLEPAQMDPAVALTVFDVLVAHGRMSEARGVIASLLERAGETPEVLLRASVFAEQQGEIDVAADTLERGMLAVLDGPGMNLDELRLGFARLFELRARQARPLVNADQSADEAVAAALAVADRWRHEDPDNPEIDRLCAELLWSLERDDEAWRHLSSSLDRHASEGAALAWVADALEHAGQIERAQTVWTRAIAVEPTDAHNHLRRAQNLLALDRNADARAALEQLVEGDWQPRFGWDVSQARTLLRSLDKGSAK